MVNPSLRARALRLLRSEGFRRDPLGTVYRRARWRLHWLLVPSRPFVVEAHGGRLELARSSASAGVYLNGGGSDPELAALLQSFLEPGMVAVDCGAHIGEYTLLFAHEVGDEGAVHAFEPHPELYRVLLRNVALNRLTNVTTERAAVAEALGEARFVLEADPTAGALAEDDNAQATVAVDAITLDSYADRAGIDRIDLVKVDVEGAEARVLAGAATVLAQLRPKLVFVECHSSEARDAVLELLRRFGYEPEADDDHVYSHVWARPTPSPVAARG